MKRPKHLFLSIAQVLVALVMMLAFFSWAPWLTAISREEAIELYHQPIPSDWNAVVMGHGQLSNFRWGTLHDNPWGFALCTVLVFGGWLFLVLTAWWVGRSARHH
jgi:hypothetical protein